MGPHPRNTSWELTKETILRDGGEDTTAEAEISPADLDAVESE